ncbi:AFG1-like ATPase-domain-containing protein [Phyllosticta capitalensis]|uniref:AFG1-like ATPase-domain-containing protein n=1 Tax=Phyllosticta capitalensis TaxID=121624 RepID=A0ABR1YBZ5_9PEZI
MNIRKYSTGVTITNPLVLYRALLATKRIRTDPAQHRLAIHLQKLYERLKDYEPTVEYSQRLHQITRAISAGQPHATLPHDTGSASSWLWSTLLPQKEKNDSRALTRVITSHEAAMELDSPRGLMLHGEVGTGKSMLIDLFADCLPNQKKKRFHFNTFMLETFAKLELLRKQRGSGLINEDDHSLLMLARDMIQASPILFLDEFQLPDRAASKIMSTLLTSFFHLGGVLIATSNRMPEELAKASGMEFTPPPTRMDSLRWRFGMPVREKRSDNMFSGRGDFAPFLEVLKARCEVWEMDGGKDYRRSEPEAASKESSMPNSIGSQLTASLSGLPGSGVAEDKTPKGMILPKYYYVKPSADEATESHESWSRSFREAEQEAAGQSSTWSPSTMHVYGRKVPIPRQNNGVASWTFTELCGSSLGPADYITLASHFHTIVLTDVPVLSLLQKNEARRFITLLDALYEARCKLLITASAGPDDIFFPETRRRASKTTSENQVDSDAVYSETFSDIYQDVTAPFRPNISSYDPSNPDPSYSEPEPEPEPEHEPDYTHARLQGVLAADALEDDPPNRVRRGRGPGFAGTFNDERPTEMPTNMRRRTASPDFAKTVAFTGEDEKFAYKRARSRLWEMCGAKWWARTEEGWWRPLPREVRRWEMPAAEREAASSSADQVSDVVMGESRDIDAEKDEVLFRHGASPFRTAQEPPPKINWTHFWGTMRWGKRAGAWGQGPDGLDERKKEKGCSPEGCGCKSKA